MKLFSIIVGSIILCLCPACLADVSPETISAGKAATALVVLDSGAAYASAFCIDPAGVFVTNQHVVDEGKSFSVVLSPGEKDQIVFKAHVIRTDSKSDLALLKADSVKPLPSLKLGDTSALSEAMEVVAFGYPFGAALAFKDGQYPNVTVSLGHLTSLRKDAGVLKLLQIDASLNPGNSGGPLINKKGEVIGIVAAGIPGTGINLAIPVSDLKALLVKPAITISPIDMPLARQHEEFEFVIQVISAGAGVASALDTTVDLILSAGAGDSRTYRAASADGKTYRVKAVPLPGTGGATLLKLTVLAKGVETVYRALDQSIVVNGNRVKLRAIQKIDRGRDLTFATGQASAGMIRGTESIEVITQSGKKIVDLSRADNIEIETIEPFGTPAEYQVVVKRGGTTIGEVAGIFGVSQPIPSDLGEKIEAAAANAPPQLWLSTTEGRGTNATWSGNNATITINADAGGGFIMAGFVSKAALRGDFDVQFNYNLTAWPGSNGMRLGLRVTDVNLGQVVAVLRDNDEGENDLLAIFNRSGGAQDITRKPNSASTGKLRISRIDGKFMGMSWDTTKGGWQVIGAGGAFGEDVRLILMAWSDDGRFSHKLGKFTISNVTVSRGKWVVP